MTTGDRQPETATPDPFRAQEAEFSQAITAVLATMPRGATVQEALHSLAGQRARTKWMLKYGRPPPL
jgi:hypothetical protein